MKKIKKILIFSFLILSVISCSEDEDNTNTNETSYTVWNGSNITFEKADGANPSDATSQDRITDLVWITRGNAGGQIYNIAMKYTDTIELTRVHKEFEADTFFPKISEDEWQLINEEKHEMDERHEYSFTYKTYLKIK